MVLPASLESWGADCLGTASSKAELHDKNNGPGFQNEDIGQHIQSNIFLAATKQLYEWFSPSVRPSVCLSHLFDYVPIIVSSWNFQELLPVTKVTSMQKVMVRGQRSRSQRSQPNLIISGL